MSSQKAQMGYKNTILIPEYLKFKIPAHWNQEILENMVTQSIAYGILLHDDVKEGHPVITSGALNKHNGIKNNLIFVSKEVEEKFKRTRLNGGEILISLVGYTGNIAIAPSWCKGYNVTRHVGVIRLKNSYDTNYFSYLLQSQEYQKKISVMTIGSAQPVINLRDLSKFIMIIPPYNEQQKIASILSNLDSWIESINSMIQKTKKLKKGLMQQLLTKGIGHKKFKKFNTLRIRSYNIPEKWNVVKFEKIVKFLGGYAFSSKDYTENGIQLLRQGNLQDRELYLKKEPVFLDKSFAAEYADYILKSGDIVVSLTGTKTKRDYGYAVLIPENSQMLFLNQRVAKITPNKTVISEFITYSMNHRYFEDQFYRLEAGTKQANVSLRDVKKINVFVPALEEQEKIISILSQIDSRLSYLKSKKTSLISAKKGLMQKLLTGQIRVKV